jgi:hypothetical protein
LLYKQTRINRGAVTVLVSPAMAPFFRSAPQPFGSRRRTNEEKSAEGWGRSWHWALPRSQLLSFSLHHMTHSLIAPNTLRPRPRPPRPRRHKHVQTPSPTPQAIFFLVLPSPKKGGGVEWGRAAAAARIRSCHSSSSSTRQGKRDKYS